MAGTRKAAGGGAQTREADGRSANLMRRPGVLLRRVHQIQSAIFAEETAAFAATPLQFSLLTLLGDAPGLEQGAAALRLNLDRFTAASVVRRLEGMKLLRTTPGADRRTKELFLTKRGERFLDALYPEAIRAHERLLDVLTAERRALFRDILQELADKHAAVGTTPPKVR